MRLDYDMATNLMRWMKTKINGYKPFTLMPNDLIGSHLSDTESLLKPSTFVSEENFSNSLHQREECRHDHGRTSETYYRPSSLAANRSKDSFSSGKQRLNLEELECDVSVEDCNSDAVDGRRQQFSFTLYDLDGHGKITKDDIASLVKTIYETLGQSITVPHYGSKTIEVKLTVSPDKKACNKSEKTTLSSANKTRNVSGCPPNNNKRSSDLHSATKTRERRYKQEQKFRRRRHSISSSGLSEDREADVSENDEEVPLNNNRTHNPVLINIAPATIFSKYKKRSTSLQRQELLQIIQANMEKNNLGFQTSRKPTSNGVLFSSKYRHGTKSQPVTKQFVNSWESPAQQKKRCKMFLNSFDMKNNGGVRRIRQRSNSYDLPNNRFAISEEKKKQPTSHELKHRYREFEQARAKEQVVRWLEQEFSSPTKYCNNRKNCNLDNCKLTSNEDVKSKNRFCSNEKREHHHIHEHVHHHYHHYHDSPFIV